MWLFSGTMYLGVVMSKKKERLNKIIKIVKSKNGSSIKELAEQLNVSEMTIRRDIKILDENSVLEVYHGAVVYNPYLDNPTIDNTNDDYNLNLNSKLNDRQKDLIGIAASRLIEADDVIIIDTGTTTEKLSKHLPSDISFTSLVYSSNNFINIMNKNNINLLLSGGLYHRKTGMFESPAGIDFIKNTRANKVFLSAAGVHKNLGITCANSYELATKRLIIKNSIEVILIVDSSKFGCVKAVHFADLKDIDTIITDDGISNEWVSYINDLDINLIIAK